MIKNTELLERVKKLKEWKKGKAYIARELDISEIEVEELVKELNRPCINAEIDDYMRTGEIFRKANVESGTLETSVVTNFEPKTPEELAELHKVDLTKYKISSYWTKQRGEKFTSSLLCTLIKPSEFDPKKFADYLKGYKPPVVRVEVRKNKTVDDTEVDVEISIADFHLDRETLENDTIEGRKREYLKVLNILVDRVTSSYSVNKFTFVIGNDFFNNDNYHGSTTNLTPQDNLVRFNEAYEEGYDLLIQSITTLSEVSNLVEVILIQGNHDRTKSYYLAHALEIFFSSYDNVIFDRENSNTKYTILGNTFIGYHHGDCKIEELPLVFATGKDTSVDFGSHPFREVHVADKHYYLTKEIKGVRIQQIPSMVNPDRWSSSKNYINNIRAGLALVYHPEKGKICEIEERV